MKRILISTVMSTLLATSAKAYTVLDNEHFNYTVGGDFEIQMGKLLGEDDVDVIFDDAVFKNRLTFKLDNGNTVFGHLNFDPRDDQYDVDDEDEGIVENFYIGATFKKSILLIGKDDNAAYYFGVEGGRLEPAGGDDAFSVTNGSDLILFQTELGPANIKISHDLAVGVGDETDTAIYVSSRFDKVGVGFAYQTYEAESSAENNDSSTVEGEKADVWGVQASFTMGKFTLAADYSDKNSDINANDTVVSNLLGAYKLGKNIFWIGLTERDIAGDETTGWYTGINHRVKSSVNVFAEVASDDAPGNGMAFTTGVRLKF